MKISIVIPVYNGEKYIERCLSSIANQTYKEFEAIIVNDGSTDQTHDICQTFIKCDSRFYEIVHSKNYGLPHARDEGIKSASGEFIAFVDVDDYLPQDSLEVRLTKMGDADLLIANYAVNRKREKFNNMSIKCDSVVSEEEILNHLFLDYKYGFQGYRWNKLFRKSILDNCEYSYDTLPYNEDRLFVCIYLIHAKKVKLISENVYTYIKNDGSMMNNTSFNYEILSGLVTFKIMQELLKGNYPYAYCMCTLNAYYSADSIYEHIPADDHDTRKKLRHYMEDNIQIFLDSATDSYFLDEKLKLFENNKKYIESDL